MLSEAFTEAHIGWRTYNPMTPIAPITTRWIINYHYSEQGSRYKEAILSIEKVRFMLWQRGVERSILTKNQS